jgi:hypothetical protein
MYADGIVVCLELQPERSLAVLADELVIYIKGNGGQVVWAGDTKGEGALNAHAQPGAKVPV